MSKTRTDDNVLVPIREPFVDARGEILNLIDAPFMSAAVITSVKGAVRGNHYHKTDDHYCWLQRGEMVYLHRRSGQTGPARRWTIKAGQMFYTPPGYEHAMQFTQDSVLLVFAKNNREMANYEADTVRVPPLE
ncbi:MAG: hypothetical protein A3C53_04845 [Omnitrophica WOR_2 bacterium RIFCSPHIGHO2_02_FULL_68_15]|nr:MAG: hypothetical protein A3C53_04845 [Omnitrophica WOR_2 bacterium RIFCSPHIGHO2_02_FULL_68_15]